LTIAGWTARCRCKFR